VRDGMSQVILPKNVDSKFRFITVAAQRAKQLQAGAKPRVETRSRKPTRIAVEETIAETISWEVREELEGHAGGGPAEE
jgi:DNA-directed RNA polymerase omega subunit